jgi:hypothetical protein
MRHLSGGSAAGMLGGSPRHEHRRLANIEQQNGRVRLNPDELRDNQV